MMETFISANDCPLLGYIPVGERYSINICPTADAVVLYLFIAGVKFPRRAWNTPHYGREHRRTSVSVKVKVKFTLEQATKTRGGVEV
jgi:hypothetical protein